MNKQENFLNEQIFVESAQANLKNNLYGIANKALIGGTAIGAAVTAVKLGNKANRYFTKKKIEKEIDKINDEAILKATKLNIKRKKQLDRLEHKIKVQDLKKKQEPVNESEQQNLNELMTVSKLKGELNNSILPSVKKSLFKGKIHSKSGNIRDLRNTTKIGSPEQLNLIKKENRLNVINNNIDKKKSSVIPAKKRALNSIKDNNDVTKIRNAAERLKNNEPFYK